MKMRALIRVRTLLIAGVVAALVLPFAATGGITTKASAVDAVTQENADLYQLDQIEVKFHRATSTHNHNLMMYSSRAPVRSSTSTRRRPAKAQIRHWFATRTSVRQSPWSTHPPQNQIHLAVTEATCTSMSVSTRRRRRCSPLPASLTPCRRSTDSGSSPTRLGRPPR